MAFESFQMNIKLTDYGYQKVMALDGAPIGIKYIGLGKGNAENTAGYDVNFRQSQTALAHPVIIKQIDSSQKESYVEDGQNLARIDTATIFAGNENFDVRELGYYDENENGDVGELVYVWSSSDPEEIYAPKRSKIHLVVSISQHLLFSEEAGAITVVDAGVPFELFLQPLKDSFEEEIGGVAAHIIEWKLQQAAEKIELRETFSNLDQIIAQNKREASLKSDLISTKVEENKLSIDGLLRLGETLTYASWSMFDYMTEVNRIHFGSGVTHARGYEYGGDSAYNLPTTIGYSAYNGHDHGNIENLVGTAEFGVMWNGIYFRLRHNDDGLYRHANVGAESFDERVPLDPPSEPSDIEAATTASEKCDIAENYIRIMAGELPQDAVDDYANSARWIMSGVEVYPEVYNPEESLRDPFPGHRHQINVSTLPELFKQEQFYNNGGHKNIRENSVGIAMAINDVDEDGNPVVVLWRYRFISADVGSLAEYPIADTLDYYEDTSYGARYGQTIEQIKASRSCRFRVKQRLATSNVDNFYQPELIDEMIAKIPGLDGYGNTLTESYEYYGANDQLKKYGEPETPLKAGNYNRFYTMTGNDASNRSNAKRGFQDDRMWVARTTDPRIKQTKFGSTVLGFSGFIPLELNIQSFLNGNFNPHGIEDKSGEYTHQEFMALVADGYGRTQDKPLPGHNNFFYFYKSPADIFDGETPTDPADTTVSGGLWITCADGLARKHFPSGYRYFLPTTNLIGEQLRTRYPIYYSAEEGSESFKHLSAVQHNQDKLAAHVISGKLDSARSKIDLREAHEEQRHSEEKVSANEERLDSNEAYTNMIKSDQYFLVAHIIGSKLDIANLKKST